MDRQKINELLGMSDAELDAAAKSYEQGDWEGHLGAIVPGRPRLSAEDLQTVSFKVPASQLKKIDEMAKNRKVTRSQLLRELVRQAMV